MAAINEKSCLGYLNELLGQDINTNQNYIGKKPIDADYSALTE